MLSVVSSIPEKMRQSKDFENKLKGLDVNTKRRVMAMHAAGVPHEAIAQKIQYMAGSKTQASRLVQGIKNEASKKKF